MACLLLAAVSAAQAPTPPAPDDKDTGVQELTRGPVHEAFGQPAQFNPEPGEVVAKAPPEAVEELPPDQKPEGDDVRWIPGYWQWDDESKDFLWVSGLWRNIPPGRNWVPGYWNKTAEGYQWVSGFWASTETAETEYLPAPPETLENGPVGEATTADSVWMPGVWMWRDTRYLWRPGYWVPGQANWVWSSPHYDWTPNGYVFVDGYWDYPLQQRGLLFAPVMFGNQLRPGYAYTPSVVIDPLLLAGNLFARPRYGHYYFGDYYAANYATAGIYPWFSYANSRRGYDPLYAYTATSFASSNPNWAANQRTNYFNLQQNVAARPARTFAAQQQLARTANTQNQILARSLADVAAAKNSTVRLAKVEAAELKTQRAQTAEFRKLATERVKLEKAEGATAPKTGTARTAPAKVKLPVTASAGASASVKVKAPPAAPKQPEPAAHDPAKAKASTLPHPEDVLKPDFKPGVPMGKEPVTPKNPLPKEPVTPKNPLPKEPANLLPKEPAVPKNPLPKEPPAVVPMPKAPPMVPAPKVPVPKPGPKPKD
ncbi:YXWGXW repeat-containing protein [Zavarzinella formosa]|uniref:YXWGXW repeat-containing protein n=1 Tax=Zavarzinella formosa TaxID=360055 RepID=UPI00138AD1AD|nr:YXWGXW repeat-containing protein [Zavarzinella formosa]